MRISAFTRIVGFSVSLLCVATAFAEQPQLVDVFVSGQDGYFMYRIPAIVVANNGDVLAFAEGRKVSGHDASDIDLVMKRSSDGGRTWSEQQIIWEDADNTCGNPCPVVDQTTGTIWLPMNHNRNGYATPKDGQDGMGTRTVWMTHSDDNGHTWATPTDITSIAKQPNWQWHGTGPGISIQLQRGPHAGRLLVPCYYTSDGDDRPNLANAIYSDDHGQTWRRSRGRIEPFGGEDQFVELSDGRVLANLRCHEGHHRRLISFSEDGGDTWSPTQIDPQLLEPRCQGSVLRYAWPDDGDRSRILFSNPATEDKRYRMTVRLSYDEGQTWAVSKLIYEGPSAYSCLVRLPDGRIGCLFEADRYQRLALAIFDLAWLTDGADSGK